MELKETDSGMKDEPCNKFVESAGLCRLHYKEYLGTLIFQNQIDPISIFGEMELEMVLRRENVRIPNQRIQQITAGSSTNNNSNNTNAESDEEYRRKLVEVRIILVNSPNSEILTFYS